MPGEFEDLQVYQKAREFRRRAWTLTRKLPEIERFVLIFQIRRAALSVTNNIAEGHGSWGYKHNISYLRRSRGSVNELLDDINACQDEEYFKKEHLDDLRKDAKVVVKLINGYIRYLKSKAKTTDKESD